MPSPQPQPADITLTLPDGSTRTYPAGTTGEEVAASIGAGLAKAAVGMKVNGIQRDLYLPLHADAQFQILTAKDEEGLDIIRHTTTAQLLANAVKELWPAAKLAIGPTIEHGFYYDIDLDTPLTPDDLPKIEDKMKEIHARGKTVTREMWKREDAIALFEARGENYKAEIIRTAPDVDGPNTVKGQVSLYRQGEGDNAFIDLCFGPHVPNFAKIPLAFKLTKFSGAYWRGDAKNKMLQRIYGVGFATDKELKAHLTMLEEAEKRDHRKLGRELDLFHMQEEAQGSVFWHPRGFTIYNQLEAYIRGKLTRGGYVEVKTPQLMDNKLWQASGHWGKYRENMFVVPDEVPGTDDDKPVLTGKGRLMALKPMNCPAHIQIFNQGIKSYRDLPIRMAEFGCCHRNEAHGALHGLMRVRQFTQDDAHIFCREDQIFEEAKTFLQLFFECYRELGFENIDLKVATRPEQRVGTDDLWDRAENALIEALKALNIPYTIAPGDGAFYGPKYEFHIRDAIGRSWTCGTLQLDYVLPERLDAAYIGEDGQKHRPVMLHRAILGSIERFVGILIEHYAGKLPVWLAPIQVAVCSITNAHDVYATEVAYTLQKAGIRTFLDVSNSKINYKVREHSNQKVPFILAVGGREMEERTVAVRRLGSEKQETVTLDNALKMLLNEAEMPL